MYKCINKNYNKILKYFNSTYFFKIIIFLIVRILSSKVHFVFIDVIQNAPISRKIDEMCCVNKIRKIDFNKKRHSSNIQKSSTDMPSWIVRI